MRNSSPKKPLPIDGAKSVGGSAAAPEPPFTIEEIIDELGPLDERIDRTLGPLKPLQERAEFLRDELRARVTGPAGVTLKGNNYTAVVGKRSKKTAIKMEKVWALLDPKILRAIGTTTATQLRAVCTDDQLKKCVVESQTGPRTVATYRALPEAA